MCRRVSCRKCGKATYAGCGQHVEQVLRGVPRGDRCSCATDPAPEAGRSLLAKIFGR